MVDVEEQQFTPEEVAAQIAKAMQMKAAAQMKPRDTKQRRATETKQRKERVNLDLLRGQGPGRDETWTIRVKAGHKKAVMALAKELSEPRAKVSYAALMDEAIELLLAKYQGGGDAAEA